LHVLGDALGSVGALASGVLIWVFGWQWADPLASLAIGLLIVRSSWELIKESVAVLMEGVPGNVDLDAVRGALRGIQGVEEVHELHVWSISSGMVSLSCHVVVFPPTRPDEILAKARVALEEGFAIRHATIQVETAVCAEGVHG